MKHILVVSRVDGLEIGAWLSAYDASAEPEPTIEVSRIRSEAMAFENVLDALDCMGAVRQQDPVRPDGKPNRPLTAYTVMVLDESAQPGWEERPIE